MRWQGGKRVLTSTIGKSRNNYLNVVRSWISLRSCCTMKNISPKVGYQRGIPSCTRCSSSKPTPPQQKPSKQYHDRHRNSLVSLLPGLQLTWQMARGWPLRQTTRALIPVSVACQSTEPIEHDLMLEFEVYPCQVPRIQHQSTLYLGQR